MDDGVAILIRWLKGEGEVVRVDEPICEVETEKATVVVPAYATGILRQLVKEGDEISRTAEIARIEPV